MPIPEPRENETQEEFIERCMSDDVMVKEYEQKQRSAICYKQWRNRNDGGSANKDMNSIPHLSTPHNTGSGNMDRELRIDEGEIKDWRYDKDDEVLIADVLMTKSQVLPYKENQETIWELLPPDELSKENWLNSSKSKAVTDLHPDEEVNYDNLGDLSKGSLTNDIWTEKKDDGTVEVWAKETVYDSDLIEDIKNGKKEQVSIGRFVEVIDEAGEFNGQAYDRKQTDFTLNHLAHVPQGRAGSDVSVRLDGGDSMVSLKEDEKWTTAYINDLPDSSFAVIEPAYKSGDTDNKNARHLPHHGPGGGGTKDTNLDLSHLRNALARVSQIKPITDSISASELRKKAKSHLEHHRDALETEEDSGADTSLKNVKVTVGDIMSDEKIFNFGDVRFEVDAEEAEDEVVDKFEDIQSNYDEMANLVKDKDNEIEGLEEKLEGDGSDKLTKDEVTELLETKEGQITDSINAKMDIVREIEKVDPDYKPNFKKDAIGLQKDFLKRVDEDVELEEKSDGYVEAKFEMLLDDIKEQEGRKLAIKPDRKDDEAQSEIEELRKKRVEMFQG